MFAAAVFLFAGRAGADDKPAKKSSPNMFDQIRMLQEQAKSINDNWSIEAMRIKEAHNIMFQRNGWTSESDLFALNLINDISSYGPFDAQAREGAFMRGLESRYGFSQDQLGIVNDEMRNESMMFTMKHFDKLMPVALEAVQAKAAGEPFTPEMVARWSQQLSPVMDEALEGLERVRSKIEPTMDESQKEIMLKDMAAIQRRHDHIKTQVEKWKRGEWTPYDFGVENYPEYASVIGDYPRPGTVAAGANVPTPEEMSFEAARRDMSQWEKYVAEFVNKYECDEKQRNAANGILKDCESEAAKYLAANGDDLEFNERRAKESPSKRKRAYHAKKAEKLRRPIEKIFDRLCRRLESSVLNRDQRRQLAKDKSKSAGQGKGSSRDASGKTASRAGRE